MQQAVTRSIDRLASCGHAGDHIELGTERSVPVYGMLRRSRDRESQPGTQTCKSIGDPVHEATVTLRERPIPQAKQPALIRVHDMRNRTSSASATCIVSTKYSGSSHGCRSHGRRVTSCPMHRCGRGNTTLPYVYPQHCAHDDATFFATRL